MLAGAQFDANARSCTRFTWGTVAGLMRPLGRHPCIGSGTVFPLTPIVMPNQRRELESCAARR